MNVHNIVYSITSNVMSAIDTAVCTINYFTVDDKSEKSEAMVAALLSLYGIVAPFDEYTRTGEIVFTSLKNLQDSLSSVIQWASSEIAEELLEWCEEQNGY